MTGQIQQAEDFEEGDHRRNFSRFKKEVPFSISPTPSYNSGWTFGDNKCRAWSTTSSSSMHSWVACHACLDRRTSSRAESVDLTVAHTSLCSAFVANMTTT